jgi:hypothetical protein
MVLYMKGQSVKKPSSASTPTMAFSMKKRLLNNAFIRQNTTRSPSAYSPVQAIFPRLCEPDSVRPVPCCLVL